MFKERFAALAPEIKNYLELRRKGLPNKHDALLDFYFIADSFTLFFELLVPWDMDA